MHWDDMRFFLSVARSKTLGGAASRLKVDATTVGRRIERLSTALNSKLFDQGPSGFNLTESGKQLFQYAEEIERAFLSASGQLTGERGRLEGTVRISLSEGFATWVVVRNLGEFRALHPDIKLEIVTTNGFLNPSKREADLAVMLARPIKGPLVARKLSNYGLGLYAAASYVEQNGVPRTTLDLRSHAMIGYIPDFIYADELRYLQEIDDKLSPGLSSSSINIQLGLTLQGMGLCVLPNFVATHHPTLGRILPEIEIERAFWIVVHRDFAKVARIRAVMDWLDALVQKAVL